MTDKEVLQMALEWVEWFASDDHSVRPTSKARETAEAIKARLAQPEETVNGWPLYSGIPKKEWVSLTDEEIKHAWSQLWYDLNNGKFAATDDPSRHTNVMFARALEAKLKEKNT